MKKQATNREYNFPDADLYMQCMERIRYAERDIVDFTTYNYDQTRIDAFKKVCNKFDEMPSDDEMLGEQMEFTTKKKDTSEKLKTAIRSIMTRVAMKYHNRSGRYRKFGTTKMGDDPKNSVVNKFGESHDVNNLYIFDGSVFPTSSSVNPANTIQSLSLFFSEKLKERIMENKIDNSSSK